MQRAKQAAAPRATASSAATETTKALVAPLLQLVRSADNAAELLRLPRALELYERALALAEATMPESTLLAATILQQVIGRRAGLAAGISAARVTDTANIGPLYKAAWRSDVQLLRLSQRCLGLLRARSAAGTLLTPTPQELCFVEGCYSRAPELLGVDLFVTWAADALTYWPHASHAAAGGADCLLGIHEALQSALAMQNMWLTRSVKPAEMTFILLCRAARGADERRVMAAPLALNVRSVAGR
jgi:hypothetical protein